MIKTTLTALLFIFASSLFSQDISVEYPKRLRLGVAAQGILAYPNRYGASVDGKLMIRANANKSAYNEFVITGKAAHQPSTDGGHFFTAFDNDKHNNISSLSLLGGYRINFGVPGAYSSKVDYLGGGFLELSAGVSYTHHISDEYKANRNELNYKTPRTWAPAGSVVAGYTVAKGVDLIVSYTLAMPVKKAGKVYQSIIGAGVQFNF